MVSRRRLLAQGAIASALFALPSLAAAQEPSRRQALSTMRRATRFMVEEVAHRGGYVWSYLADFSRRWGEMEAKPSMIWTQAPGTPEMGQIFLDAYHATGDEYYYRAAERVGEALMWGQHESGGWNYIIDFDGEASIRDWYETIGRNGWRLEEFHHYYGNATFDDHATVESGRFLIRLFLEKRDQRYKPAVDKAIDFVLRSQYPVGGWPQRYPRMGEFQNHGQPDYTGYVTLNDEVAEENIDFLLFALQQLNDERVREPIRRAMDCYLLLQRPMPTPGWALQYTLDLLPAAGRTYEPRGVSPHTTGAAVDKLMDFYLLTGERKFLTRIPEVLDWLDQMIAPPEARTERANYFRYVEEGTNRFIFVRRRGSNAQNGEYYHNYDPTDERAERHVDNVALRRRFERVSALDPAAATAQSVLQGRGRNLLPRFIITRDIIGSDLNAPRTEGERAADAAHIATLIAGLNRQGYWPTELRSTSHPYRGPGPATPPPGFVDRNQVGDEWDTSPFTLPEGPIGISTAAYIRNMSLLVAYVAQPA